MIAKSTCIRIVFSCQRPMRCWTSLVAEREISAHKKFIYDNKLDASHIPSETKKFGEALASIGVTPQ